MTRHEIYFYILETGLLNIRLAAKEGDTAQCFAEADHLHNMPALLMDMANEELHQLYALTMKPSYLSMSKPEYSSRYSELWKRLEESPDETKPTNRKARNK